MKKTLIWSLIYLWVTGCATYGGWEPTVDPRGSVSETLSRDLAECKQLARQAAGDPATKAGIGALVGGAVGAASGAVIGAATGGDAGEGAAVGAAIGGVGAGAHQALSAEEQYKQAYIKCLEGRGHRVLN